MAKFTLTFTEVQDDYDEIISAIAKQNNLDVDKDVVALVHRFTDGCEVTLQFDTEKKKCWVLFNGKEGINDWKVERDVVAKTVNYWEKYTTGRKTHVASLQAQIDEALQAYKDEEDKKSPAARNLLRFIEDVRQELNAFKGANWNKEDGGESNSPFIA